MALNFKCKKCNGEFSAMEAPWVQGKPCPLCGFYPDTLASPTFPTEKAINRN